MKKLRKEPTSDKAKNYLKILEDILHDRWTKDDTKRFFTGLDLYGKNWVKIVKYIGTKSNV